MKGYKGKFYLLLGAIVAVVVLAYYLSIDKALTEYRNHSQLLEKTNQLSSIQSEIKRLSDHNNKIDQILGIHSNALTSFEEQLLNEVGNHALNNNLQLVDFSEPLNGSDGGFQIKTITVTTIGDFKSHLKLIHHLENEFRGGQIVSASLEAVKDYRTNKINLYNIFYVQEYSKKS